MAAQYRKTLVIKPGNAHNVADLIACLSREGAVADAVGFSVGNRPDLESMKNGDAKVCKKATRKAGCGEAGSPRAAR